MKSILITGGMGFIGLNLALHLIEKNYSIIIFDKEDNNKGFKPQNEHKNITLVKGDIQKDSNSIDGILKKFYIEGIIHLAAISRVKIAHENPKECERVNIQGGKSLLSSIDLYLKNNSQIQSSKRTHKPWLIFGSSREVYGKQDILPVKENAQKLPINNYGISKIKGEKIFEDFAKANKLNLFILRFSNVYGNEYDLLQRVIPKFINALKNNQELILEGGRQVIDFTHVDDTVDSIFKAMAFLENANSNNQNIINDFHILPAKGWTLQELIFSLEQLMDKKAKIKTRAKRDYDVEKFIGDDSKIKSLLKTRNFLGLHEGLKLALPKYLKNIE